MFQVCWSSWGDGFFYVYANLPGVEPVSLAHRIEELYEAGQPLPRGFRLYDSGPDWVSLLYEPDGEDLTVVIGALESGEGTLVYGHSKKEGDDVLDGTAVSSELTLDDRLRLARYFREVLALNKELLGDYSGHYSTDA